MESSIVKYLPDFLQEIKEFKEIAKISESFIKDINVKTDNILKDLFILKATEEGIKHYEEMLKIKPKNAETLESRRLKILLKYNQKLPYTYENLISVLNNICGEKYYEINIDEENLILDLKIHLDKKFMLENIKETVENIVPMNINLKIDLRYTIWKDIEEYRWEELKEKSWGQLQENGGKRKWSIQ